MRNHADGIAAIDLFVVPTVSFRLLYGLLIVSLGRRQILWLGSQPHASVSWLAIHSAVGIILRLHARAFGERHLRHVLLSWMDYYNAARAHLSLCKDAPVQRRIQRFGSIEARPILGGLHHQYVRIDLR